MSDVEGEAQKSKRLCRRQSHFPGWMLKPEWLWRVVVFRIRTNFNWAESAPWRRSGIAAPLVSGVEIACRFARDQGKTHGQSLVSWFPLSTKSVSLAN